MYSSFTRDWHAAQFLDGTLRRTEASLVKSGLMLLQRMLTLTAKKPLQSDKFPRTCHSFTSVSAEFKWILALAANVTPQTVRARSIEVLAILQVPSALPFEWVDCGGARKAVPPRPEKTATIMPPLVMNFPNILTLGVSELAFSHSVLIETPIDPNGEATFF